MLADGLRRDDTNTSLALAAAVIVVDRRRARSRCCSCRCVTVFLAYRAYADRAPAPRAPRVPLRGDPHALALARDRRRARGPARALARGVPRRDRRDRPVHAPRATPPLRTTLGPGDYKRGDAADRRRDRRRAARARRPRPARRPRSSARSGSVRAAPLPGGARRHRRDARDAPGETRVVGTMLLANRYGVVREFCDDDLQPVRDARQQRQRRAPVRPPRAGGLAAARAPAQLEHQAFHDSLTGPRQPRAVHRPRRARRSRRPEPTVAVLFIDLDDFKTVNDTLGHAVGDELLVAVAERLRVVRAPERHVARLGGDEFAVLLDDASTGPRTSWWSPSGSSRALAQRRARPATRRSSSAPASASPPAAPRRRRAGELIRDADVAMYQAKQRGKGRFDALRAPHAHARPAAATGSRSELQQAVERGEFVVEYQPIVAPRRRRRRGRRGARALAAPRARPRRARASSSRWPRRPG